MAMKTCLTAVALILGAGAVALPVLAENADGADQMIHYQGMMDDDQGMGMMGEGRSTGAFGVPKFDFAGADANSDGKVTKDELAAFRQTMMSGVDADGDGLISTEELAAHMKARMDARIDERARARVESQDLDGDGKLSATELLTPALPDRMFARLDTDGDGAISQDELTEAQSRMQERMRDGHGKRDGHGMRGGDGQGRDGRGWFGWGQN